MTCLSGLTTVKFLGSAWIDLDKLLSACDLVDDIDCGKIPQVKQSMQRGCSRLIDDHHVPVVISRAALEESFVLSELSSATLAPRNAGSFPYLKTIGHGLHCLRGKHRLIVAKDVLPPEDRWWVADLYTEDSQVLDASFKHLAGVSKEYNQGELYCAIRQYLQEDLSPMVDCWKAELSEHARKNLQRLLRRKTWQSAFDDILKMLGLRKGLPLSRMHHIMDTHCDEEILRYLDHIKAVWYFLVGNSNYALSNVDEQMVEVLEFSAPLASLEDLSWLQGEFNAGRIFKSYTDRERKDIFERLQQIRGLIPGLTSFQCNIKYVSAVVGSLRSL